MPLYVGADLDPQLAARVALHLESCEPCSELLLEASALSAARLEHFELAGSSGAEASLWPMVRDRLRSEGLVQPELSLQTSSPAPAGRLLHFFKMSAAAAGLLLVGSLTHRSIFPEQYRAGVENTPVTTDVRPVVATPTSERNSSTGSELIEMMSGSLAIADPMPLTEVGDPDCSGTPLRAMSPGEQTLTEQASPYYGEVVRPFNPFLYGTGNNAASYNTNNIGGRRKALR